MSSRLRSTAALLSSPCWCTNGRTPQDAVYLKRNHKPSQQSIVMNSDLWTEHMKTITKSASLEDQALMSPQDLGQLVHAFTFSRLLWRCVHMSLKKISQKATADAERCSLSLKRTRKVDHISQYIKDRSFFYCLFHKARDLRRYFAIWIELLLLT